MNLLEREIRVPPLLSYKKRRKKQVHKHSPNIRHARDEIKQSLNSTLKCVLVLNLQIQPNYYIHSYVLGNSSGWFYKVRRFLPRCSSGPSLLGCPGLFEFLHSRVEYSVVSIYRGMFLRGPFLVKEVDVCIPIVAI